MKGQQKKINVLHPLKKGDETGRAAHTYNLRVWGTEVKKKISGSRPASAWTMRTRGFHKTKAKGMKK